MHNPEPNPSLVQPWLCWSRSLSALNNPSPSPSPSPEPNSSLAVLIPVIVCHPVLSLGIGLILHLQVGVGQTYWHALGPRHWDRHGTGMGQAWDNRGTGMGQPWDNRGTTVGPAWGQRGAQWDRVPMVPFCMQRSTHHPPCPRSTHHPPYPRSTIPHASCTVCIIQHASCPTHHAAVLTDLGDEMPGLLLALVAAVME